MSGRAKLGETRIGPRVFRWGTRTFVMGIINVTPDSFSGDGLLPADVADAEGAGRVDGPVAENGPAGADDPAVDAVAAAVAQARAMAGEGADMLDVGGESTRPGHAPVDVDEEIRRVIPVVRAIRDALPDMPLTIDTTKPSVADAALAAGADAINDVWGVAEDDTLSRIAAQRRVPIVLMHNRAEPHYEDLMSEIVADLAAAIDRALASGVPAAHVLVDPGFGFGKTPGHNLALLRELGTVRRLGRPILLGTSRKSTLGRILDLPPEERVEATLATTVLGIAAGVDVVRVHDVRANVRAARVADAVVRA